jgi:hypothetical protein
MRQMIKGLLAALAVTAASAVPAAACGWGGGWGTGCCNTGYVSPCAQTYAPAYTYSYGGCGTCNTGWAYERLAEPETQYYYVNQGPTYSGPGAFAPHGEYQEEALPTYGYHHYGYRHHGYGYGYGWHHRPYHHSWHEYGYAPRHYGYAPRHYGYGYHRWGGEGTYYGHPLVRRYY